MCVCVCGSYTHNLANVGANAGATPETTLGGDNVRTLEPTPEPTLDHRESTRNEVDAGTAVLGTTNLLHLQATQMQLFSKSPDTYSND